VPRSYLEDNWGDPVSSTEFCKGGLEEKVLYNQVDNSIVEYYPAGKDVRTEAAETPLL
jgi:hypothetical protein